ncbi:MAG: DUF4384 domain-containing protein [Rhodospirillales bacterium]
MHNPLIRFVAIVFPLFVLSAWCEEKPKLTPRELFYSAPLAPPAAPAKADPAKKASVPRPARSKPAAPRPEPVAVEARRPAPAARAQEAVLVPVASQTYGPLGLRYSLLKIERGRAVEVSTDEVFRAGDRIRLSVEANDTAHLYIVNRGSSGIWKVLFPSPEIAGGSNVVERGRRYEIPQGYTFTFDEQPGAERLFIVLARQPEPDLERLIYSLEQPRPAEGPRAEPAPKVLLAQSMINIDDALVGRFRTYARDLIIEKVDAPASGVPAEKATYAVNASGAADARVVADVTLQHR